METAVYGCHKGSIFHHGSLFNQEMNRSSFAHAVLITVHNVEQFDFHWTHRISFIDIVHHANVLKWFDIFEKLILIIWDISLTLIFFDGWIQMFVNCRQTSSTAVTWRYIYFSLRRRVFSYTGAQKFQKLRSPPILDETFQIESLTALYLFNLRGIFVGTSFITLFKFRSWKALGIVVNFGHSGKLIEWRIN